MAETWGMQGHSEVDRELLDAAALCRQLVPEGSVEAFLADHRHELFPDAMFEDLFPTRRGRGPMSALREGALAVLPHRRFQSAYDQIPRDRTLLACRNCRRGGTSCLVTAPSWSWVRVPSSPPYALGPVWSGGDGHLTRRAMKDKSGGTTLGPDWSCRPGSTRSNERTRRCAG
jgi:hypothetical protein